MNSRHHQGIDRLGSGLLAGARSPEGLIEAVEGKEGPNAIFAVQWHPENLAGDPVAEFLFEKFRESVDSRIRYPAEEMLSPRKGEV